MPSFNRLSLPEQPLRLQRENKVRWNSQRSRQQADFYTIGYAGRTLGEFVYAVKAARVSTIVDIRQNPVSLYKPEFSRVKLRVYLEDNGLQYLHRPELGVPRDIRAAAVGHCDRDIIWQWYDRHVVSAFAGRNLDEFFNWADHPVALMCVECDPYACHRHRLALALEDHGLKGYDL